MPLSITHATKEPFCSFFKPSKDCRLQAQIKKNFKYVHYLVSVLWVFSRQLVEGIKYSLAKQTSKDSCYKFSCK